MLWRSIYPFRFLKQKNASSPLFMQTNVCNYYGSLEKRDFMWLENPQFTTLLTIEPDTRRMLIGEVNSPLGYFLRENCDCSRWTYGQTKRVSSQPYPRSSNTWLLLPLQCALRRCFSLHYPLFFLNSVLIHRIRRAKLFSLAQRTTPHSAFWATETTWSDWKFPKIWCLEARLRLSVAPQDLAGMLVPLRRKIHVYCSSMFKPSTFFNFHSSRFFLALLPPHFPFPLYYYALNTDTQF